MSLGRSADRVAVGSSEGPALAVEGVSKSFGGVRAVSDVTVTLERGAAVGIIGPNGAGKSTLLKLISGMLRPDSGTISLFGEGISGRPLHHVARAGVVLASQIPQPFRSQTVRENVLVAQHRSGHRGRRAAADALIVRCGLEAKADTPALQLGLLDLKRLEVARALATDPAVLLLDEVAAGLNGRDLDEAIQLVRELHESGISVMVVEHIDRVIRELVERVFVLDWGRLIADGTPAEIAAHEEVRKVYLGNRVAPVARERTASRPTPVVEAREVSARYGDVQALSDVSLEIGAGEIVAVLGANGAGKSTLASVLSGHVPLAGGSVVAFGKNVSATPAHLRARQGIAHCPEGRHVFAELTVRENLTVALPLRSKPAKIAERLERVHRIFPILHDRRNQTAGTLSGGEQQMLSVARALMTEPRLLICDELSLGLAPVMTDTIYRALRAIAAENVMLLLIEQDVSRCLEIADWIYVLLRGHQSYAGPPSALGDEVFLDSVYFGREPTTWLTT